FGITSIMDILRREGSYYYSLGSTFGTQLGSHPNADPKVGELLDLFHDKKILNEEGNFLFKKKFHPTTTRFYLSRRRGADASKLPEVLTLLANPERPGRSAPQVPLRPSSAAEGADEERDTYRAQVERGAVAPLVGRRVSLATRDVVFESRLDVGIESLAFLNDHRI